MESALRLPDCLSLLAVRLLGEADLRLVRERSLELDEEEDDDDDEELELDPELLREEELDELGERNMG